jgi:hypothetical protein
LDTGEGRNFPSIAKAKKESHKLQMETDGALGLGCLEVIR